MKELSIEEKAKRYDEAIERARKLKENPKTIFFEEENIHVSDYIFPELKESEDERIRKWIRKELESKYVVDNIVNNVMADKCLAWLEKQVKVKESVISQHEIETCKENSNSLTSEDEKIREVLIHIVKNACSKFGITYKYQGVEVGEEKLLAWLEKQGEQPQGKTALEAAKEEKVDNANKVEPKFHEGDWVVWENKCYKVNYNGCGYELIDQNGLRTSLEYGTVDTSSRLWDITIDAKDGDVLLASDGSIFIFKEVVDFECKHYIALEEEDGTIQVNDNFAHCWESVTGVCPATKEQRDTLMKAMSDAGYTFDFDKKELKKIEDEIEIPFGAKDSELHEVTYYIPKGFHAEIDDDKVVIKKGEKSAWSEEDAYLLNETIQHLKLLIEIDKAKHCACDVQYYQRDIDWLKSLKDRVGCEANFTTTWKPSEEQIHWLKWAKNTMPDTEIANEAEAVLEDLLEQLKKL